MWVDPWHFYQCQASAEDTNVAITTADGAAINQQPRREPRRKKSLHEQYFPTMLKFISWRDGTNYSHDTVFTPIMLQGVTATDFYRFCKFKVYYGDPDADETVMPPVYLRHNTINGYKKHCSHFLLNQSMEWNEVAQIGNPTRSRLMKKLLKSMKRFQTQKRGRPPKARRPMKPKEFEQMMELYWGLPHREKGLVGAAVASCQFQLIGRNDDVCKWREDDLNPYHAFPQYAITAKLCWSKNVTEERDCPTQVVVAAMDTKYDAISNLALWLEYNYEVNPGPNEFLFGIGGEDDPERIKEKMGDLFTNIVSSRDFVKEADGLLGTHSIRKMAATFCRSNGCSKVSERSKYFF